MADSEVAALTEDTTPDPSDWVYLVDSAGTVDKKVSVANLIEPSRSKVVSHSAADVTVISTTSETDLIALTLPANPVAGDLYVAEFAGTMLNNVGSTQNLTLRFYLGATAYLTTGAIGIGTSASPHQWRARFTIYITDSTHQELSAEFSKGAPVAAGTLANVSTAAVLTGWAQGLEDTSTSKTVKMSATLQSGGGSQSMTASFGVLSVTRV